MTSLAVAAAASSVTLSGLQAIDGVAGADGLRVLCTGQVPATSNGLWVMHPGVWTRPTDQASGSGQVPAPVVVMAGSVYGGSTWAMPASVTSYVVDVSLQSWTLIGSSSYAPIDLMPQRVAPGETPRWGRLEVASAVTASASPAVNKPLIIVEQWDQPSLLTFLTFETDGGGGTGQVGPQERTGFISIYIDDDTTPWVNQIPVGDFFGSGFQGGEYAGPLSGRSLHGAYFGTDWAGGFWRYFPHCPAQKYLRVEYLNASSTNVGVWAKAGVRKLPASIATGDRAKWFFVSSATTTGAPYQAISASRGGRGQVESAWFSWQLPSTVTNVPSTPNWNIEEGNPKFFLNGSTRPQLLDTGSEDYIHGAFGGFPLQGVYGSSTWAGSNLAHGVTGGNYPTVAYNGGAAVPANGTFGRHFMGADPIFFDSGITFTVPIGQQGQANYTSVTATNIGFSVCMTGWVDASSITPPSYKTPNKSAPAFTDTTFGTGAIGQVPTGYVSTGTTWVKTASGTIKNGAITDTNVGAVRATGLTAYWTEIRLRCTAGATAADSQGVHVIRSTSSGYNIFNDVGAELHRVLTDNGVAASHYWQIFVRDANNEICAVKIDEGLDLTNTWIRLAAKVMSDGRIFCYWKFDDPTVGTDADWQEICWWTSTNTGTYVGVGSYNGQFECSENDAYPLLAVTS